MGLYKRSTWWVKICRHVFGSAPTRVWVVKAEEANAVGGAVVREGVPTCTGWGLSKNGGGRQQAV